MADLNESVYINMAIEKILRTNCLFYRSHAISEIVFINL